MRIGILKTDSVRPEFQDDFGDYPDMFRRLLLAADPSLEFTDYDVQRGEYPEHIDACDAYLITGSRDSVYDDEDWIRALADFVDGLHRARRKLIAICFGHQLVAHFLGGETQPADVGWGVGVKTSDVVKQPPWMDPPADSVRLLVSHKDQVTRLPDGAEVFAMSGYCPVAGYTLGEHIFAVQGHPEFAKGYSRSLIDWRRQLLGERCADAGLESLAEPTDEQLVASWIVNFIRTGVET
jgi:GMP synthase-like glutamine amidotransferase